MRRAASWAALVAATVAAGWGLGRLSLPSSYLFGALLVGLLVALTRPDRLAVRPIAFSAAQALTGVVLGTYLQSSALAALGHAWLPVVLVSGATLVISVGTGVVLAGLTGVDVTTGALGMVAGGASGIVTMADELGGDDRLVAFMQYVRVLLVVVLTPVLIAVLFPGHHAGAAPAGGGLLGDGRGWLLTAAVAAGGAVAGRATRLPAGVLLGPMILSGAITLAVPGGAFDVPTLVREGSFALIGLQVGLRFTVATVRQVGRMLVPVVGGVLFLLAACFGLAAALSATGRVSLLGAYLATTPGGIYAVLATAFGAGANTTFIVGVQALRLLVMVVLAPLAVRWVVSRAARRARRPGSGTPRTPGRSP